MSKYKMPDLPDNQRWLVSSSFNTFLHVKLQENRYRNNPWWGWRTIAESSEYLSMGAVGVERCVDHIKNRDYYARLRAEREARREAEYNRIPFGASK